MLLSFRNRLALQYSVIIAITLITFSLTVFLIIKSTLIGNMRLTLESLGLNAYHELEEGIMEQYDDPFSYALGETHLELIAPSSSIQIFNSDMKLIHKIGMLEFTVDKEFFQHAVSTWEPQSAVVPYAGTDILTFILPKRILNNGYLLVVNSPMDHLEKTLDNLKLLFVLSIVISLIITGFSGLYLADRALKPIDKITITAKNITEQNLQKRLPEVKTGGELGRLTGVLNEMLDRLEDAFINQKRFLSDASHEIRSPLTIMKGNIEVTLRRPRQTDEYIEILNSNLEEINRLTRIVNDLITLARSNHQNITNTFLAVCAEDIIRKVVSLFEQVFIKHQLAISITKETDDDLFVMGNGDQLHQLFTNLIENSIRYTPPGGTISISLCSVNRSHRISIRDTGIGISEFDLPHIFERFYRADKARTRAMGGAGLGLSICKYIVEAHNGTISVNSVQAKGTEFVVTLPAIVYNLSLPYS